MSRSGNRSPFSLRPSLGIGSLTAHVPFTSWCWSSLPTPRVSSFISLACAFCCWFPLVLSSGICASAFLGFLASSLTLPSYALSLVLFSVLSAAFSARTSFRLCSCRNHSAWLHISSAPLPHNHVESSLASHGAPSLSLSLPRHATPDGSCWLPSCCPRCAPALSLPRLRSPPRHTVPPPRPAPHLLLPLQRVLSRPGPFPASCPAPSASSAYLRMTATRRSEAVFDWQGEPVCIIDLKTSWAFRSFCHLNRLLYQGAPPSLYSCCPGGLLSERECMLYSSLVSILTLHVAGTPRAHKLSPHSNSSQHAVDRVSQCRNLSGSQTPGIQICARALVTCQRLISFVHSFGSS